MSIRGLNAVRFVEWHDGRGAVVKRASDLRQLCAEAETLRAFGEHRAVLVLDVQPDERALTLERIHPGTSLASEATEDEAMNVVAGLLSSQWPPVHAAPSAQPLEDFARALNDVVEGRDERTIAFQGLHRARALFRELQEERVTPVLLHGDLHYENVLKSDRAEYVLIDPKGVLGEPAFDVGYLVSRPSPSARDHLPLPAVVERRLAFLPDAIRLDAHRVAAYAYVSAALSAAWALEDRDRAAAEYVRMLRALEAHALVRSLI